MDLMDLDANLINLEVLAALEEAEINAQHGRRFHTFDDPFENLSDRQFVKLYRLNKPLVANLIDMLQPYMVAPSRISALSIERKVLTALRFFASGSYQLDIGNNVNHAVSQSSVSRALQEVTDALNQDEIFNNLIRMPRNIDELRVLRNDFYERHNFPGVIGCIDCTHVAIYPPNINHDLYPEAVYVNRKGYHSINVQLVCDSFLRIINVCARYPGNTHDSFIFNNSNVLPYLQNLRGHLNEHGSFYLLGDSGYALRPWMLTPITNAQPGTPEAAYNERQMSTRSPIERCNGILKLRFRCLLKHRVLHYAPSRCSKIINACSILHNMCINNNLPPVELHDEEDGIQEIDFGIYANDAHEPQNEEEVQNQQRVNPDLAEGRRLRQQIIRNHFRR